MTKFRYRIVKSDYEHLKFKIEYKPKGFFSFLCKWDYLDIFDCIESARARIERHKLKDKVIETYD